MISPDNRHLTTKYIMRGLPVSPKIDPVTSDIGTLTLPTPAPVRGLGGAAPGGQFSDGRRPGRPGQKAVRGPPGRWRQGLCTATSASMSQTVKPKTIREFVEFCNSFPRGRRVVGYVSTIGFFVFIAALCVAIYFQVGFFTYLVLALCLFLSSAHSSYAFAANLTQRKVRKIDYWYLGAATLGMLLLAAAYSNQRDTVISKMLLIAHQSAEEPIREKVISSVAELSKFLCEGTIAKASIAPCEGLKKFSVEIKPHLSAQQIKSLKERFTKDVTLPYGRIFPRELIVPQLFSPLSAVDIRLDDWAEFVQSAPSQTALQRDEQAEIMFGLGQWVIWPFLLAYALALRLTKVTIDVFEWAK
jgi:hypothetical protein